MNVESSNKLETIIISIINRLYAKETNVGLDIDDLRMLEILWKIAKESKNKTNESPLVSTNLPTNLIDLLRAVKGSTSDDDNS